MRCCQDCIFFEKIFCSILFRPHHLTLQQFLRFRVSRWVKDIGDPWKKLEVSSELVVGKQSDVHKPGYIQVVYFAIQVVVLVM